MSRSLVITRPKADAKALARTLEKQGFPCLIEPMFSIRRLWDHAASLTHALERKPQVIIATSKHAITAFAAMHENRSVPVVTVGKVTAEEALKAGFYNVSFASGTAIDLLHYIKSNYTPDNGSLLYIRGREISTDLVTPLVNDGFDIDSVILYYTQKMRRFSPTLRKAIQLQQVDAVMFFSQNTVSTYAKLAMAGEVAEAHNNIAALCLSEAIAEKASKLLPWCEVTLFDRYFSHKT
ncbi:MAG TPA: uroporphyrinogen-III synthase [Rickettsiales bacterium]|nr:uroporphyrinogen-III synthase [Rickettsiales bacterium]